MDSLKKIHLLLNFEEGILKPFRWDVQFVIIINTAWLYTLLGVALGRKKGGPGGPLEGSAQVLWSGCEDTLMNKDPAWGVVFMVGNKGAVANPLHSIQPSHLAPSPVSLRPSSWHSSIQGRWLSYGKEPIKGGYRGWQLASFLSRGSATELKIERWWTWEFSSCIIFDPVH